MICLFFLTCTKVYTQENAYNNIIIANGAELYSTEESFNRQILANNSLLNTCEIRYQDISGKKQLIISAKKTAKKENAGLTDQLQAVKNLGQKKALKQLKDVIDQYEKRVQSFTDYDFNNLSSEQSFTSIVISKSYVTSSQRNDFGKYLISENPYEITTPLNFLYFLAFLNYNNKSINFCSSEIFFVRPPPTT